LEAIRILLLPLRACLAGDVRVMQLRAARYAALPRTATMQRPSFTHRLPAPPPGGDAATLFFATHSAVTQRFGCDGGSHYRSYVLDIGQEKRRS
jgi:hypothetical protein